MGSTKQQISSVFVCSCFSFNSSWTFERHPITETEQLKISKTSRENEKIPQKIPMKIPGKIPKGRRESYSLLSAAVSNTG